MSFLSLLLVHPIHLGSAEGEGGNIYMVMFFKNFSILSYKWFFKIEGKKCILFTDSNRIVDCTMWH